MRFRSRAPILMMLAWLLALAACSDPEPPHFGAFLKDGRELVELEQLNAVRVPSSSELDDINIPISSDIQPVIILWMPDTQLEYLRLASTADESFDFSAAPMENGALELQPSEPLESGRYCYRQGDPLAMALATWCFEVSGS